MNILVIGESALDIWKYGKAERLDPAAPAIVFNSKETKINGGMAANVKNNLESLGAKVHLLTNENWQQISKTRFVDKKTNYILLREDINDDIYGRCDFSKINFIDYDAVVISDYDKGFLTQEDIKNICLLHPLIWMDTKKEIGKWCECVDYIKINNYEVKKAKQITSLLREKLIITLGAEGASHQGKIYPVSQVQIKDVAGAGDSFLSALVVEYLKTKSIEKAIIFANECATKVVQKPGVSVI